uniref:hypothetical protein n=1 Tax=Cryptosporangium minutisporangium TaxID=113569 RepID=UPI0036721A27
MVSVVAPEFATDEDEPLTEKDGEHIERPDPAGGDEPKPDGESDSDEMASADGAASDTGNAGVLAALD